MSDPGSGVFRFGPYRLDAARRTLLKDSERLTVPPKVFETLLLLIQNAHRVVTKDEIVAAVWPDVSVSEASLKQTVASVRRVLDGDGEDYIETVPRIGYRFAGPVGAADPLEGPLPAPARRGSTRFRRLGLAVGVLALSGGVTVWAGFLRSPRRESPATSRVLAGHDVEVRTLVARGRHHWLTRSGDGLFKSMLAFKRATELDPGSAPAWSGLADAHVFDLERWQNAEGMAKRALELDPSQSQPHATLGFLAMAWRWDLFTSGVELGRALAVDPGNSTARQWLALRFVLLGQLAEAQVVLEEAAALHPTSLPVLCDRVRLLLVRGKAAEARQALSEALDLDPWFVEAHKLRLQMALLESRWDDAAALLQDWPFDAPEARGSRRRDARELGNARFLEAQARIPESPRFYPEKAGTLAVLGRHDEALALLEQSIRARAFLLPAARTDPMFASLRGDPRFQDFLRRLSASVAVLPREADRFSR